MSILETFIFGAAVDSPGPTDVYAPYDPANAPQMGRVYEAFARSVRSDRRVRTIWSSPWGWTQPSLDCTIFGDRTRLGRGEVAGAAAVRVWHCGLGRDFSQHVGD